MKLLASRRSKSLAAMLTLASATVWMLLPTVSSALPQYAAATGQPCATCHVNPAGGGTLTATGTSFAAIPTHSTDPAGAWAQLSAPAAPAPAPAPAPAAPAPAPAAGVAVSAVISGVASDDSVTYAITLTNPGTKDIANIFVAGSVPDGATLANVSNPPSTAGTPGGNPVSVDAVQASKGAAAWIVTVLPPKTSFGPLLYTVTKGSASDLSATAFVHWLAPSDGSAAVSSGTPLDNTTRLGVDQEINRKLNTTDRTLALWGIQPGLGTVMIEYGLRFANQWFAAQSGNWDMVRYQIDEMREIQEVGETTRPGRAAALKAFESAYLDALDDAAESGDLAAYTAAYDKTISGCNSCHAAALGVQPHPNTGAKFIKIKRPSAPVLTGVDWAGQ